MKLDMRCLLLFQTAAYQLLLCRMIQCCFCNCSLDFIVVARRGVVPGLRARECVCVSCCLSVCPVVYWSLVVGPVIFPWCLPPPVCRGRAGPGVLSPWRRPAVTFHLCSVRPSVSRSRCVRLGRAVSGWLSVCSPGGRYWSCSLLLAPGSGCYCHWHASVARSAAGVPCASYSNTVFAARSPLLSRGHPHDRAASGTGQNSPIHAWRFSKFSPQVS